jgi:hypothetical protein
MEKEKIVEFTIKVGVLSTFNENPEILRQGVEQILSLALPDVKIYEVNLDLVTEVEES